MKKLYPLFIFFSLIGIPSVHAQFTNIIIDNFSEANEPSITINPLNPNNIIAGANATNSYHSVDGGANWIPAQLNSSYGEYGDPCLIADSSGNLFYFHLANPLDRVVCQRSTDGGATYNNGTYCWNNDAMMQDKEWATVDAHSGNVYVTWTQYDNGFSPGPFDSSRIFFSRSMDTASTFTPGMRIDNAAGDCLYLDVTDARPFTGPNGEVYVIYMDPSGIRLNKSLDSGSTWLDAPQVIDSVSGGGNRYFQVSGVDRIRVTPMPACDRSNSVYRGNIYVSSCDQRNGVNNTDIFFTRSTDGGNTWSSALRVNSDSANHHQYRNAMAVDQTNGYIYIVFYDRRNYSGDSTDVYLAKSTDGGTTWTDFKISSTGFEKTGSNGFDGDYIDISAHAGIVRPIWTRVDFFFTSIWTCLYDENVSGIAAIHSDNGDINFSVNPNPADVVAVVSFTDEVENIEGGIFDASGRKLLSFAVNHEREKILDLRGFPNGIFIIKAGSVAKKLVIGK